MSWDHLGIFTYGIGNRPAIIVGDTIDGVWTQKALYRYTDEELQKLCESHGLDFYDILLYVNTATRTAATMLVIDVPTYLAAQDKLMKG